MLKKKRQEKILLVDDTPSTFDILRCPLEKEGYHVYVANNGEKAIKRAAQIIPNLILLDVLMPGMDGLETCRRLKNSKDTRQVPIIFMTALTSTENKVAGFKAGGVDYITKPIEIEEVLVRIKTQLTLSKMHRKLELQNRRLKREITERRHAEELIKKKIALLEATNKELESFSYSVSHDLRAPLRAISGFCQILDSEYASKLDSEGKRLVEIIIQNAHEMSQLINDLLNFSHSGWQAMRYTEVDMTKLVKEVIQELKSIAPERKIDFRIASLPSAQGDRALLHQIFMNLLNNAVKFTAPKENAVIEVGSKLYKGEVFYYVKDNGVGFDMQYSDKMFGVFQRLHRSEEFDGTGVGLAVVQRIINRHGGRVWAEGKVGNGAAFYFTLPNND